MSAIVTATRRPRGRPQVRSDDETRRLIAEAARAAFMANGYSGASMDEVAKAAGISKKTLYRLVPTKADLFRASTADRIARFMMAVDEEAVAALPVAVALERIMGEYALLTLSEETIAVLKLVIAESDRFPELASNFFSDAIVTTQRMLAGYLERQCRAGVLVMDDPYEAAGMLRGMMVMEPQRAAMLGQSPPPGAEEIARRVRTCVALFLRGCQAPRA